VPRAGLLIPLAVLVLLATACTSEPVTPAPPAPAECNDQTPGDLFAQRIEPLFKEDRPKSCNQCHLSGIDLSSFSRDTPCETMACLVEQGMVDLDNPEESKVLSWIERAHPDSKLITEQVIQEEYDGFLAWIEYSASCQASVCSGVSCQQRDDDPFCDTDAEAGLYDTKRDPGGCSDKALEQVFRDTVYGVRDRCFPCHFEKQANAPADAPRWISQEGSCDEASLLTMHTVTKNGYANVDDPAKSLLLLKPLGPANGGVEHGGSTKFDGGTSDTAYRNFLYWLERYSDCQKQ
jgi:hypothetical protein